MDDTDLAGLVCARMCHDLASPVGAVVNGADLLCEIGGMDAGEELRLVQQSAQRAASLIQLLRLAFGHHADPEAALSRRDLRARIDPVLASNRVQLAWNAPETGEIPMLAGRLIALMAMAARGMLGPSGAMTLMLPAEGGLPAAVMAEGPRAAVSADQRGWLTGTATELPDSRQIEFALLPAAAAAAGARLDLVEETGRLALRAHPA